MAHTWHSGIITTTHLAHTWHTLEQESLLTFKI